MYKYLILSLLMFGCEEQITPIIIPPILPPDYDSEDTTYESNLTAINSGHNLNFATINWSAYENDDFISYQIITQNDNTISEILDFNESSYDIELAPASFEKVYLQIETNQNIFKDSIEVFTRPVLSTQNFDALTQQDQANALTWTETNELSSIFENYTIYRKHQTDYWNNFFNDLNDCNCIIEIIENKDIISYIDQSPELGEEQEYFYMIQTNTINDYTRNSIIKSNIGYDYSYDPEIDTLWTSQSEYNKIIISWIHNLNQNQFYELQIWRSQSEDIDPLNETQLVTITDYNRTYFEDSYEIGNGIAWFYKIKLIDIYGNIHISDIVQGNSHP